MITEHVLSERRHTDPPIPNIRYRCKTFLRYHCGGLTVFFTPFILSPLLFLNPSKEFRCLYIVSIVAIYWTTNALPLYITSMIPVVTYPFMGVLDGYAVADVFVNLTSMEILCTLILGLAFELCNLHKRIALGAMMISGFTSKRFHFGVLMGAMVLSMWIPNETTVQTMCPIIKVLFDELADHGLVQLYSKKIPKNRRKPLYPSHTMMFYYLSVVYATVIGSCGTLIGTGSNLTIKGLFDTRFPKSAEINYVSFMMFSSPIMIVQILFLFLWLQIVHMGLCRSRSISSKDFHFGKEGERILKDIVSRKYKELGAVSLFEAQVIFIFLLLNILMFTCHIRGWFMGWCELFNVRDNKTSTAFLMGTLLFFLVPQNYRFLSYLIGKRPAQEMRVRSLLTWQDVQDNIQWGRLLLFGGGFVLARGVKQSGLSHDIGIFFSFMERWPHPCLQLCCILAGAFLTVFSANIAVCTIMVAVLAEVSSFIKINPVYLTLPTALACGLAFLLPISAQMNAEVASFANIPALNMAIMGLGPTIISVFILFLLHKHGFILCFPISENFRPGSKVLSLNSRRNIIIIE